MAFRVGLGSITAGAVQKWFFQFGGNGDAGAQYFLPHPLTPAGELVCTEISKVLNPPQGPWTYFAKVRNDGPFSVRFAWDGGGVT
jgi:hypothetical protein